MRNCVRFFCCLDYPGLLEGDNNSNHPSDYWKKKSQFNLDRKINALHSSFPFFRV